MTDLSPTAQAVLDAHDIGFSTPRLCLAAAFRSAADQVVPHEYLTGVDAAVEARQLTRLRFLAIAKELDSV